MTRTSGNEHDWFRRHLPDHLLDLLVEGERRRFLAHARECPACARTLARAESARPDWWDGAGHPTVSLLLRWDSFPGGNATRQAVRAHLARCEDCRRDLAELCGPEAASGIALAPLPASAPVRRRPAVSRWQGLAGVAATIAAVIGFLVVWPRDSERTNAPGEAPASPAEPAPEPVPPARGPSPAPAAPAPAAPAPAVAEPVPLATAERGVPAPATEVAVGPGVERVPLTLPAIFVPDGVMIEVTLRDPAGTTIARQVLAAEKALRPGGVVLPAEVLGAGRHVLALRWVDPVTGETSRQYPLDVRVSREP